MLIELPTWMVIHYDKVATVFSSCLVIMLQLYENESRITFILANSP